MSPGDNFSLKLYAVAKGTTDGGQVGIVGAFQAFDLPKGFAESLSPEGELVVLSVQVLRGPHRFVRTDGKSPSPEDWLENVEHHALKNWKRVGE